MSVFVKSYKRKGKQVSAYQRKQGKSRYDRLNGIYDRLNRRKSKSGLRGIVNIQIKKARIADAIHGITRSPADLARQRRDISELYAKGRNFF